MLETIGYDATTAASFAPWDTADASIGRVTRVDRGLVTVLTESGPHRVSLGGGVLARMAHDPAHAPCAGDWAVVREWPDQRMTLEHVLPRRTALTRVTSAKSSHDQVLCANVDLVAAVVALHPEPPLAKVERLLALAWDSGARPVVVLTKADLVSDAAEIAEDVQALVPDVDVLVVSVRTGAGVDRLRALLEGRHTLALVGASGHGKSSLTNALVGAEVLATRAIRDDGRGRHTSVRRELVPLAGGGAVIDTPGLRQIGLVESGRGLERAFAEVDALVALCKFDDCTHRTEPGCAVLAAVEEGSLPLRRYESWQRLQRERRRHAERRAARVRAEERKTERKTERKKQRKQKRRSRGRGIDESDSW